MRCFWIFTILGSVALLADECQAQTMAGMSNPSIAPGNMSVGANVATVGPNGTSVAPQWGLGGSNRSTLDASTAAGATNFAGAYPRPGFGRYYGQNSNTAMGTDLSAPTVAMRPGQPLTLNRSRSMFSGRSMTYYNPNGQRFGGAAYGPAGTSQSYGPMNYRLNNSNLPGYYGRASNSLPMYNGNRAFYGPAGNTMNGPGPAATFLLGNGFNEGAY